MKGLTSFDAVAYDILAELQQPVVWLSRVPQLQIKKLFQLFRGPPLTNLDSQQWQLIELPLEPGFERMLASWALPSRSFQTSERQPETSMYSPSQGWKSWDGDPGVIGTAPSSIWKVKDFLEELISNQGKIRGWGKARGHSRGKEQRL